MSDVIKKGGPVYVGNYMREQALENRIKELESKLSSACTRATDFENDARGCKARMHDAFNVAEGLRAALAAERERAGKAEADPSTMPAEHVFHLMLQDCASCHAKFREKVQ